MGEETIVNVKKYRFNIVSRPLTNKEGEIYCYNFRIGGNYADCVNISVAYDAMQRPVSAKIPTLVYDTECSLAAPLDRGEGTIEMIKTLLRHVKEKIPEINEFVFEDKSNIEFLTAIQNCAFASQNAKCGTEEEKYQKRRRKRGTYAVPLVLYYFSIAFNGETWYEKHFNAYQKDTEMHKSYRKSVDDLLRKKEMKPEFNEFLRIAQPPTKYLDELQALYNSTTTYGEFFNSMPKTDRCRLVREWIPTFMEHYLAGVFKNSDWVIDVRTMDKKRNNTHYGGTRKKGRHTKSYYCPLGRIRLSFEQKDSGI
jgi:hypothetical protein